MFKSINMRHNSVALIPNGVNTIIFYPIEKQEAMKYLGWENGIFHIIFVSNPYRPEKNFSLAKEVASTFINSSDIVKLHTIFDIPSEELKYYYR